ncbi:hypothetical protein IJF86_02755 [Candidatus Saccharibacteria bacterium]|nr:hypothetical protein [Candidatus Saccharibacteria bacterium]
MRKSILKIATTSALASVLMAFGAHAAATGNVLTLTASEDADGVVTFSGTTDVNVLAVSCSLLDADENEVLFGSTSVDEAAFGGEFTVETVADYTLRCANYDGGNWVSAQVTAPSDEEEEAGTADTGRLTNEEGHSAKINSIAIIATAVVAGLLAIGAGVGLVVKHQKK